MKLMETIDFRETWCEHWDGSGINLTEIEKFITDRLSSRLTKVIYRCHGRLSDKLSATHPQLFPKNFQQVKSKLDVNEKYQWSRENTRLAYEQLYIRTRCTPHPCTIFGRQDVMNGGKWNFNSCYNYVMQNDDKKLLLEDFNAITQLTWPLYHEDYIFPAEQVPLMANLFTGLTELVLMIDYLVIADQATKLRNIVLSLNMNVSIGLARSGFLAEDCQELLGCYLRHFFCHPSACDRDLQALTNLESFEIELSSIPTTSIPDMPPSVSCVTLRPPNLLDDVSSVSGSAMLVDFLGRNGRQIEKLSIFKHAHHQERIRSIELVTCLLDVIAEKCHRLTSLRLNYMVSPSVYLTFLTKLGANLTKLQICVSFWTMISCKP
ncbi:hypothetical protein HDE_01091 [Halotydeus destructor]|nr:hypothetical protein HDE_01091 [Halotydeus destructor]